MIKKSEKSNFEVCKQSSNLGKRLFNCISDLNINSGGVDLQIVKVKNTIQVLKVEIRGLQAVLEFWLRISELF